MDWLLAAGLALDNRLLDKLHCLMWIAEPARRHGIADADIWHAVRNAMRRLDNDVTILLGPAGDGSLLEVGVLDIDGDDPVIVHAMPLRSKYYPYLG